MAFESATRIDDWVRFGTPPWSPITVEEDLLTRDSLGEHGKPHARFQKWTLNNFGMRGPDVSLRKPSGTLRVVTAGASETFGLYERPGREFPRQLEDSLRRTLVGDHCDGVQVEVLNAAIFGMSLPSADQDLRTRVAVLHPDVVVMYPTPVQYLAESVPRATPPSSSPSQTDEPWYAVLRPRATSRLREQIILILPAWARTLLRQRDIDATVVGRPGAWRFASIPESRLESYDRDLRHVIGTIHSLGSAAVIMTHADLFMPAGRTDTAQLLAQLKAWQRLYPRATESVLTAFDSAAVATTLRVAQDSGAPAVDLANLVRQIPAADAARLFGDYAHFTDAGSALVAGALSPAVVRSAHLGATCGHTAGIVITTSQQDRAR